MSKALKHLTAIRQSSLVLINFLILSSDRTPLHCAGSCNDRNLCEFLVRNGAAVMAMTQSDGATASQKCDPYAYGYEECESFLRGEESSTQHICHALQ